MNFIKKLAVHLCEIAIEMPGDLLKVAVKSLYYAPLFYGIYWLGYRHAPTHDMWFGFAFAAILYTTYGKRSVRLRKEDARPSSSVPLHASD